MHKIIFTLTAFLLLSPTSYADDGLVHVPSQFDVQKTADRLEHVLKNKGMTIFARINHQAGAEKIGQHLRPTELIIFGNPKVGSLLMNCSQTTAIDLPQKALIWQNEEGEVLLSYNEPSYLKQRHHIQGCDKVLTKITSALHNFATAAASK